TGGGKVSPFALPRQRRREHAMARLLKQRPHLAPAIRAAPRAMNQDVDSHISAAYTPWRMPPTTTAEPNLPTRRARILAPEAQKSNDRFEGFPDETIQFLLELQAEQSRTWFKAHQDDFVRLCRRPLELFVAELQERLTDTYPRIGAVEPHIFR